MCVLSKVFNSLSYFTMSWETITTYKNVEHQQQYQFCKLITKLLSLRRDTQLKYDKNNKLNGILTPNYLKLKYIINT